MARVILFQLFLFLLPFLLYWLFVFFTRRSSEPGGTWSGAPITWLAGGGLVLTAIGFFVFAQISGTEPGGVYEPARLEDGRVIPGRVVPAPDPADG